MTKVIQVSAAIAVALAGLAILEPKLYNDLLDAVVHFIGWLHK